MNHRKLCQFQRKCMVLFLGVPAEEIPLSLKECDNALDIFRKKDPVKFAEVYKLVAEQKIPDGSKLGTEVKFEDLSKILKTEIDRQEKDVIGRISAKHMEMSEGLNREINNSLVEKSLMVASELQKVSEAAQNKIHETIAAEAKKFNITRLTITTPDKKEKHVDGTLPEEFPKLLQLASSRINTMMVGPTGCGKTFVAHKVAEALGLDFASQSCSAGVSESAFTGWLIPTGDKGKFEYVQSEFVRLYENGGVFLFDEIDASDPNVLVFMNQALANGSFSLPQRHKMPRIKKHKDFHAIAAANTHGSGADSLYHGRNALDEATLDRFRVGTVFMDYSAKVEESIIEPVILQWGRNIRQRIAQHKLRRVLSTRTMLDASTTYKHHNWSISEIEKGYFASWSKEEMRMVGK